MKRFKKEIEKKFISHHLKWLPKKNLVLSLVSALLFFLTTPPFNMFVLGFFAFIPFFIIQEEEKSAKKLFLYGWAAGILFYLCAFYWLLGTIELYGNLPFPIAFVIFLFFCFFFALKYGLFFFIAHYLTTYSIPKILSYAASLLMVELFFPEIFPFYLGNSQISNAYFIQIIDIIGIKGLSFIIIIINYFIYDIFLKKDRKTILILTSLVFVIYSYGVVRLIQIKQYQEYAPVLKVGLIQPDTDFLPRINREQLFMIKNSVLELTQKTIESSKEKLDFIVWPESATPFQISGQSLLGQEMLEYMKKQNTHFIFSELKFDDLKAGLSIFSVASFVGPSGNLLDQYKKVYLLPFAEYMPLSRVFPFLNEMIKEVGLFEPGNEIKNFKLNDRIDITPLICYEIIHPDFVRKFVKKGGDIIVNITNDKWFGKTNATYEHLWLLQPRAIENRLPIVRATNSGTSVIIDQAGNYLAGPTPIYEKAYLTANIPIIKDVFGLYTYSGDWPLILILLYTLFLIFRNKKFFKI